MARIWAKRAVWFCFTYVTLMSLEPVYHHFQKVMESFNAGAGITQKNASNSTILRSGTAATDTERISVHPNASLRKDILSIDHNASEASITLQLEQDGRCPRPFLRGRLSGPALVAIRDWKYYPPTGNKTGITIVGTYPSPPFLGKYYLEIIVVYCDNFVGNDNDPVWNNSNDFKRACTEDPLHWQLTRPGTAITVTMASQNGDRPGYWIHNQSTTSGDMNMKPLYTRYQLNTCYRKTTPECTPPAASIETFQDYQFQWQWPGSSTRQLSVANLPVPPTKMTVCLLGSSHARKIYEYLQEGGVENATNIQVQYHDVRMPFQVTVSNIQAMIARGGCDILVISVGQWPAGKQFRINADGPMNFRRFYLEYQSMIQRIHENFPNIPALYRSINYNPIGALIAKCPPTDWRSPAVIDGYNAAIQQAVDEIQDPAHVRFLDTDFLVGPMWDAASDWCHLDYRVGLQQGLYVLEQALQ